MRSEYQTAQQGTSDATGNITFKFPAPGAGNLTVQGTFAVLEAGAGGQMIASGGEVSGDWQEATRGVNGSIAGRLVDDHLSGFVNAIGFTAGFAIRVIGRQMSFSLRPSGTTVTKVDVQMSR